MCVLYYIYIVLCCFVVVVWCFFLQLYTHVHLLYANSTKCPDKWINQYNIYIYIHILVYYIRFPPWFWQLFFVSQHVLDECVG